MTTLSFEYATGGGGADGDSGNVQLLRDIEEISNALYLHQTPVKPLISLPNHKSESNQKTRLPPSKSMLRLGFTNGAGGDEDQGRQKKSSIWRWKPLKALSHVWQKKYDCSFFCHVHCIENLPLEFNGLGMSVHWKRKDNVVKTFVSRVSNGMVEFDETMTDRCLIYCSRSGPGNFVKYESKHYLLFPSIVGSPGLDIGRHWVDLTRLLPLTVEELVESKSPGKWTTSYNLGGKAQGATLHVSFGFLVVTDNSVQLSGGRAGLGLLNHFESSVSEGNNSMLRRIGSASPRLTLESSNSSSDSDVKVLHQVWPNPGSEFSDSVDFLYKKLDDENQTDSEKIDVPSTKMEPLKSLPDSYFSDGNKFGDGECIAMEFTLTEKGTEVDTLTGEQLKLEESISKSIDESDMEVVDVSEIFKDEDGLPAEAIELDPETSGSSGSENVVASDTCTISCADEEGLPAEAIKLDLETSGSSLKNDGAFDTCTNSCNVDFNTEDLDMDLYNMFLSGSLEMENRFLEPNQEIKSNNRPSKIVESLSLDAITKAVADDFLKLLEEKTSASSSTPSSCQESPRERLLREFERDAGKFLFSSDGDEEAATSCFNSVSSCSELSPEDMVCPPLICTSKIDLSSNEMKNVRSKAKSLECLETKSLMDSWGLDEEALGNSYDHNRGGFGSPIYVPPKEVGLPPLGEGLGSFLNLEQGGFLRSLSRSLFHDADSGGVLIIQASRPIVLPAKVGSDIMEVLQFLASIGLARLCKMVLDLMPLEEISGKVMQQISQEAAVMKAESDRVDFSEDQEYLNTGAYAALENDTVIPCSIGEDSEAVHIPMQNLPFLLMDQVENLLMEGLRIQSGVSDMVAPSTIDFQKNSSLAGDIVTQLSAVPNSCGNAEEALMNFSISLDEWLKLDSTNISNKDQTLEHLSRLLAAHDAQISLSDMEDFVGDNTRESGSLKSGLLGDNPTVAIVIQLRDPARNFEPVGAPMLSLIEVNRKFDHTKPATSSEKSAERTTDIAEEIEERDVHDRRGISKFAIRQAHLTGLSTELEGPEIWATRKQRQAGHRWLLSNNMSKTDKHNLSESTAITRFYPTRRKQQPATILWSISHESSQLGAQFGESSPQNSYSRNPDIVVW